MGLFYLTLWVPPHMFTRQLIPLGPFSLDKKGSVALYLLMTVSTVNCFQRNLRFLVASNWAARLRILNSWTSEESALYLICKVLTHFAYFPGLKKCVLVPVQRTLLGNADRFHTASILDSGGAEKEI